MPQVRPGGVSPIALRPRESHSRPSPRGGVRVSCSGKAASLALCVRTATERECALRVRFDPFATRSVYDRSLRTPVLPEATPLLPLSARRGVPVSPIQTLSNSASLPPYLLHRLVLPEADENGVAKQPRSPRDARLHRRPRRNSRRLESQLRPCADMVNRHIGALLAG
jgi:hypothetical protein